MIVDLLVSGGLALGAWLQGLIPTISVDFSGVTDAVQDVVTMVGRFDQYFPVVLMLELTGALIAVRPLIAGFRGLLWLYHQFWGSD